MADLEMCNYPRICIVTPCYNHGKFIGQTIESVINQGYPNLQYIVINHDSTDNSHEVISRYVNDLYAYKILADSRNSPATAINYGFSFFKEPEVIGWLSSDDLLLPRSLFILGEVFSQLRGQVHWVTGMASTVNIRGNLVRCKMYKRDYYDFLNNDWRVIQQESTFFTWDLWQKAGGALSEQLFMAYDTELWSRYFLLAEHFHLLTPLGAFRKGSQSRSTRSLDKFLDETNIVLKKMIKNASRADMTSAIIRNKTRRLSHYLPCFLAKQLLRLSRSYRIIYYNSMEDKWHVGSTAKE